MFQTCEKLSIFKPVVTFGIQVTLMDKIKNDCVNHRNDFDLLSFPSTNNYTYNKLA